MCPDSCNDEIRVISRQGGVQVLAIGDDAITKQGLRVRYAEEAAMKLVAQYTDVPVAEVGLSTYRPAEGKIVMTKLRGSSLQETWHTFPESRKENVCNQLWDIIAKIRQIPKPSHLQHLFQCGADGSPSDDVLIKDLVDPPSPILNDDDLRHRVY
jgi:hypothetical protein